MRILGTKQNNKTSRNSTEQDTREPKGAKKQKSGIHIIALNVVGIIIAAVVLGFMTMLFLQFYTRHYNSVEVPAIKGMSQEEARATLEGARLKMEVVDSVYNESLPPGVIMETTPSAGAIIKDKRTIYVVINNMQIKKAIVPDVYEVSRRQAEALIRRAGFTDLTVSFVPGEYNNLALRVKNRRGQILTSGDEIPFNTPLTLEVSSKELLTDSLRMMNDSLLLQIRQSEAGEVPTTDLPEEDGDDDGKGEDWF